MIRKATAADQPMIESFLAQYPDSSMFLRSNLATQGISQSDHAHATDYYLAGQAPAIDAVLGVARQGYVMVQAPKAKPELWQAFAKILQRHQVVGLNGEAAQILALNRALGLTQADFSFDQSEPLYRLDLAHLPKVAVETRPPEPRDIDQLTTWFMAYHSDTGLPPGPDGPVLDAINRATRVIETRNTRLLIKDGGSVAMTSFNARYDDMVQIGGVYTPPELRNRGYARQVVASHLAEVRAVGITTAILFANNTAAARAYEAIGFVKVGAYRVSVLNSPLGAETAKETQ